MRRRPLTPFGSHSIEKGIIHFRRGNADNPIRPTQSPADFQQRDGRGIASALEITQGRHGHATPFRRRLKRQIRRQTRRTNARTQRLQKFLPRLIDHNCSYKDRKRAYYTTTVFTKAIVRIMHPYPGFSGISVPLRQRVDVRQKRHAHCREKEKNDVGWGIVDVSR